MGGGFEIFAHGLGRVAVAFVGGESIEEVGDVEVVPGVGLLVLVEFDLQVYLHQYIITAATH